MCTDMLLLMKLANTAIPMFISHTLQQGPLDGNQQKVMNDNQ